MRRSPVVRLFLLCLAIVGFVLTRSHASLASYYQPVGRCIDGGINLDDPVPFTRLELDDTSVGLAASGGGSRAAYLTAAVLREIRRSGLSIHSDEPARGGTSLLDQIDVVSSVSGGSLASAYFVAHAGTLKASDADDPVWTDFLAKMAADYRVNQYWKVVRSPSLWGKFLFTNYHRGLLARDDYDELLFGGATLATLPERPALYINSFDVANHVRFVLSKQYIDTAYYQPSGYWGTLAAPQDFTSDNDLTFTNVDPGSVSIADAVYASSAFPLAYPNLALKHCGTTILFQGRLIFLADGGLADNSGLITLLTQLRAATRPAAKPSALLAISIDASLGRVDRNGSAFQQRGIEDTYAWRSTIIGHANESINAAIELLQDVSWKFIQSTGVVTDQINLNWPMDLTARSGTCGVVGRPGRPSWQAPFESGRLTMRPLIVRLGLRDVVDPDFLTWVDDTRDSLPNDVVTMLPKGLAGLSTTLTERLLQIETDFALSEEARKTLDVAAYLLVHLKLARDLEVWNGIARQAAAQPRPKLTCAF